MSIRVTCEGCGKVLSVPDGAEGRTIQCAHCKKRMRVPSQASQAAAEPAQPAAAPAAPVAPPAAPATAPATPPETPDKDAFFKALAEEAAREQDEAAAAKAAQAAAEAELEPAPEAAAGSTPAASSELPGKKELHIKTAAGKAGYGIVAGPASRVPPPPPPPEYDLRPHPLRKVIAVAVGLLLLIGIIIGIAFGLRSRTPPAAAIPSSQEVVLPANAPPLPTTLKEAAQALAAGTLVEVKVVEARPGGQADADATAQPTPVLTPTGELMLDATNVHIRDGSGADVGIQQMMSAVRPEVYESVAAQLREKGLTPMEAGRAAAAMRAGERHSRLTIFISVTPAWAGFDFRGPPPGSDNAPSNPDQPSQPGAAGHPSPPGPSSQPSPSPHPSQPRSPSRRSRRGLYTLPRTLSVPPVQRVQHHPRPSEPSLPPSGPVKLWERLLSGGLTISARFGSEASGNAAQGWSATADDDSRADMLPFGLRLSIVRVAWEVEGRTHDLAGQPAAADAALSGDDAETGMTLPFRRPQRVSEIQITARMDADRTCLISGFCQYDDVDLHCGAAAAGERVSALLPAPAADWRTLWDGKSDQGSIAAACRNILRLGGGPAIAEALTAKPAIEATAGKPATEVMAGKPATETTAGKPGSLPQFSADVLVSVLKEDGSSPEWASAFLAVRGPCGDAALICLARQAKEENQKDFLQWVTTPAGHSPESVQAACCALIDLGRPVPEVNALIDTHAVKNFSEVRSPRGVLAFPPQTAQTVLDWLIRNGTRSQRIGAAAAVAEGNIKELQDPVRSFVGKSLGSDPETLYRLCKGLEKTQSPLGLEILSSVAQRQLMQTDAGDRFLPTAAFSDEGAPPEGRFSRTVAARVCADLARYKFEAGKALAGLLQSPGPATRYCAIETLMALDDVDVSPEIRARFEALNRRGRNAYETQEWELLNPTKNKLCRYDIDMIAAENNLKDSSKAKDVIEFCDKVIKENPSPALVERVKEMRREAERQLETNTTTPNPPKAPQ